ncbi:MAG: LuxR C-terminal-related transcriptional regulator [Gammaproteobacteria bacterium]
MTTLLIACADLKVAIHWQSSLSANYRIALARDLNRVLELCRIERSFELIVIDYALLANHYDEDLSLLQETAPDSKILLIGNRCNQEVLLKAFGRGIPGYMEANLAPTLLQKGVDRLLRGEVWLERKMVKALLERLRQKNTTPMESPITPNLDSLTPREIEIARRVCIGESNKRIARHLDITERTVKAHMSSIFRKLEITDRLQLAIRLRNTFAEEVVENAN